MAEHPDVALIRRGYDAFSTGDVATLSEIIAPDATQYQPGSNVLCTGDCIFLYTDGITEAQNSGSQFFTDARLADLLAQMPSAEPTSLVEHAVGAVRAFADSAPQSDDMTALAVRYAGKDDGAR